MDPGAPSTPALNIPPRSTSSRWADIGGKISRLGSATGARLFPPLGSVVDALAPCLNVLETTAANSEEYDALQSELEVLSQLLEQYRDKSCSARMSGSVMNILHSIEEHAKRIGAKSSRNRGQRLATATIDEEEIRRCWQHIGSCSRQLQASLSQGIWSLTHEQLVSNRLERLGAAKLGCYDSSLSTEIHRRTCTSGTRTSILTGLDEWSTGENTPDLYWMNGMAGTGKTTIACSFSKTLNERHQLAASFFCTRTSPECRDVGRIIPTIAYQLARFSLPFQSALCEVLGEDPDIGSKLISSQAEMLLKKPLRMVGSALPRNLVVVIDALDECDNLLKVRLFLTTLLQCVADLPIKFFLASRPEPEIYNRIVAQEQRARTVFYLHEIEKSLVQEDIELYLREELRSIAPTESQIVALAERSGKLFIFAATLVRYVLPFNRSVDPLKRLEYALEMTSQLRQMHATIDGIYMAVIQSVLNAEELDEKELTCRRLVLWAVLCAQEPVDVATITALTGLNSIQGTLDALNELGSVIHFSEISRLVSTLHASFPDFMFNRARSKMYFCDAEEFQTLLTVQCFKVMEARLQFNICQLQTSFIPDKEAEAIEEKVLQYISPSLWYACQHWSNHLPTAKFSEALCRKLQDFLIIRLLFWMEVLNLKRQIGLGTDAMLKAQHWLEAGRAPPEKVKLAKDAWIFIANFATNPVSESTPHIYLSALPFCANSSSVFQNYSKITNSVISVGGTAVNRVMIATAVWETESEVHCVAYSPKGGNLVYGGSSGTVYTRNFYGGAHSTQRITDHASTVSSVSYSPDGSRIISGSHDCTLRVYAQDGMPVTLSTQSAPNPEPVVCSLAAPSTSPSNYQAPPTPSSHAIRAWTVESNAKRIMVGTFNSLTASLSENGYRLRGTVAFGLNYPPGLSSLSDSEQSQHGSAITSVRFSPDGSQIVSASTDHTVGVWNARNGKPIFRPLIGHFACVTSVAYSPDGLRIASGSQDFTIRTWDSYTGAPIAGPFTGHTDYVTAVAYSPDGLKIASGSHDRTIRVWNSQGGEPANSKIKVHASRITSLSFSPTGEHIVSGFYGGTIRVWDSEGVHPQTDAFVGHMSAINSVTYSPDGRKIVSGSEDSTVRLWSTNNSSLLYTFTGHTGIVSCVAYSPNGLQVASGSHDRTIRLWDPVTGRLISTPVQGHGDWINSLAYSPDGLKIVSGSDDRTIRVWRAQPILPSGQVGPFCGHTDWVTSVAYSPSGEYIASGSDDSTVRVWKALDGAPISKPFVGHTSYIESVAYSPDGSQIASGSNDHTLRIWHSMNGVLLTTFEGHTGGVTSVSYSPNGIYVASGSHDSSVRTWDVRNGKKMLGPFTGHSASVTSVRYSPDNLKIVSGSKDHTVRVWNALDGTLIAHPFRGHTNIVTSVAYSPDGSQIVSGSLDRSLRFWSVQDLQLSAILSMEEPSPITSIVYSPDNSRISCCSNNKNIAVLNALDGSLHTQLSHGVTSNVVSVAFTSDGSKIVVGCEDGAIRIMNTHEGTAYCGPFKWHDHPVVWLGYPRSDEHLISISEDYTIKVPKEWVESRFLRFLRQLPWCADFDVLQQFGLVQRHLHSSPNKYHDSGSILYLPDAARTITRDHDGHICVWDVHKNALITRNQVVHEGSISAINCSSDGLHIVSGSDRGEIQVSNASNWTPVVSPFTGGPCPITAVACSSDGTSVASGFQDGMVRIWNMHEPEQLHADLKGWKARSDGWFTDRTGTKLLFWVPLDYIGLMSAPNTELTIGRNGSLRVDFRNALFGARWHECFDPMGFGPISSSSHLPETRLGDHGIGNL